MGMTVEEYRKLVHKQQKGNKLNAVKTNIDGLEFDSKSEAKRYAELKMLQAAGEISDLQMQVEYVLIPSQRDGNGRVIEKECSYIADFVYFDNWQNKTIVEDVKGYTNPASATYAKFVIKRKLMLYIHGIRVVEVKY